jgi:hypothetical protein
MSVSKRKILGGEYVWRFWRYPTLFGCVVRYRSMFVE